jgi:hypothetical protein
MGYEFGNYTIGGGELQMSAMVLGKSTSACREFNSDLPQMDMPG